MKIEFKKGVSESLIEALKKESLFVNCILPDISSGKVFLSVRDGCIDFYYRGGRLFTFDGKEFSTHQKYASVIADYKKDYIKNSYLSRCSLITDFEAGYGRIKDNCEHYAKTEALGVCYALEKFSIAKKGSDEKIQIIDIEVTLTNTSNSTEEENKQKLDRVDMVVFNKSSKTLHFVEAKHFTNKEWRSIDGEIPKVINQIKRYQKQSTERKAEILYAYTNHVEALNKLLGLNNPSPLNISPVSSLYLFGFDNDQKNGQLRRFLDKPEVKNSGICVYPLGDPKKITSLKSMVG